MTQNPEESPIHGSVRHLNPETLHKNPAFTQVITVAGPARTIYIGGQDAEKDGLIKPPLRVSEEVIGKDGPSKQLVEYYSPHQLFIVVGDERLDTVVRAKEVLNRYVTSYPGVLPQVILPF
jgi:hypothetical protein